MINPVLSLPVVTQQASSIRSGLQAIDEGTSNVALVIDENGILIGVVTDGDLRRALLKGASLEEPLYRYMTTRPVVAREEESRASVLDLMLSRSIDQIPVVDQVGRLLGLHTLRGLLGRDQKENPVLILAGGRGTRLGNKTRHVPKPMLRVAGRPILERLIDHCVGFGFTKISLSVSYKADEIVDHFSDGSNYGCQIKYLFDPGKEPRGTGGPFVDFVQANPESNVPVLVMNGDLVTDANLSAIVSSHVESGAVMTVAVHSYTHEVPFGVVECNSLGWVSHIDEKPLVNLPISSGIYVISPTAASGFGSRGSLAMTDLIHGLLVRDEKVWAYPMSGDWQDVGSPADLDRAQGVSSGD